MISTMKAVKFSYIGLIDRPFKASLGSFEFAKPLVACILSLGLVACGGDDNDSESEKEESRVFSLDNINIPDTYTFDSKFTPGQDSVNYSGQTKRHLLINDLVSFIGSIEESSNQNVIANLNFYFDYDSSASDSLDYLYSLDGQTLTPGPTYGDVSSGKNLIGKTAGNDPAELLGGEFFGWSLGLGENPEPKDLVEFYFSQISELATDESTDQVQLAGGGSADIDVSYVSPAGLDYKQLVQKFLLGAITYSQGTADYLKTNFGENNDTLDSEGALYSGAEHKWDEAFGYFGAARNYNTYTDDELAGESGRGEYANGYNDANGDGLVDLASEINLGNSTNCAKRDRGSVVATDFTKEAFDAFVTGRAILSSTSENLSVEALAALETAAITASTVWEQCIAATVIHYINDSIADIDAFSSDGLNGSGFANLTAFKNYAKHWSEMKGFALGLQFNPESPFRETNETLNQLKTVLTLMGDAPILPDDTQNGTLFTGGVAQYRADLISARDILEATYQFSADNVAGW